MDVGLVRKLGAPGQPELGIGALGEDGTVVLDEEAISSGVATPAQIKQLVAREAAELERRQRLYRGNLPALEVKALTVIVIDDGIATGVTVTAATEVLRARGAARIVVAVPVCSVSASRRLRGGLDELICLERPARFGGVGAWYEDFSQTADREVIALLRASRSRHRELDQRH
jgi:putative phosphoribosyl transferase